MVNDPSASEIHSKPSRHSYHVDEFRGPQTQGRAHINRDSFMNLS